MTEEEMAAAIEVNEQRTQEYKDAGILPETELPPDLTVEDVGVDLYSVTGPQAGSYRQLNRGNGDIEGGVQMQPAMSMQRSDDDFANTNPFNPNLQTTADTATPNTTDNNTISAHVDTVQTGGDSGTTEGRDVESADATSNA